MPASKIASLPSFQTMRGPSLIDGTDLTKFFNMVMGSAGGIVAKSGGGVTGATQLSDGFSQVDTVAANNDSVLLPPALVSGWVWIVNNGASTLAIYNIQSNFNNGSLTDTITPHGSTTPNAGSAAVTLV